jgi:hypothetical protein
VPREKVPPFIGGFFKNCLGVKSDDPVWGLLDWLEKDTPYFSASDISFHPDESGSLVRYSLVMLAKSILLSPVVFSNPQEKPLHDVPDFYYLSIACLVHNYVGPGLGIETMGRLKEFIRLPLEWDLAIRWSGKGFTPNPAEAPVLRRVLSVCPEAVLLRTADQLAGVQVKWEKPFGRNQLK